MDKKTFGEYVNTNQPKYVKDNIRIELNIYHDNYDFISAKHIGYRCPSMYNDSPPENGNCDLSEYIDKEGKKNLLLLFLSDDYSEQLYLKLKVHDIDTLEILYDSYNTTTPGTILKRAESDF